MDPPPLDPSDPEPSVETATPGVDGGRPESLPSWAYGLLAVVLILPALIWSAAAFVLSVSVEW